MSLVCVVDKIFLKADKLLFALVDLVLLFLPPEHFMSINSCYAYIFK